MRTHGCLLVLAFLCACSADQPVNPDALVFETSNNTASNDSTDLSLQYPVLTAGVSAKPMAAINTQLESQALAHFEQVDADPLSFDEYAENFQKDNYEALKEEPSSKARKWLRQSATTVVHKAPRFLSLRIETNSFLGTGHPNRFILYFMMELPSARIMHLEDVFEPSKLPTLRALLEQKFRAQRGLASDGEIKSKGFLFDPGQLQIPESFALRAQDAVFHFDTYTVAPYAAGPTEIAIPLSELQSHLRPAFQQAR